MARIPLIREALLQLAVGIELGRADGVELLHLDGAERLLVSRGQAEGQRGHHRGQGAAQGDVLHHLLNAY